MSDRAAEIRSRYLRICAMDDSLSAQSTGAAIAYSLDVPWLIERVAELEAARDRVLALHRSWAEHGDQPNDTCRACARPWPCETVRVVEGP
jgi:hypothetical protein